jgi:hypothetical protein
MGMVFLLLFHKYNLIMKNLFIAGLMLLAVGLQSCAKSNSDLLTEKPWKVQSIMVGGENVIAPAILAGMTFTLNFATDGTYAFSLAGENSEGTWAFSSDEKAVITTETGQTESVTWTVAKLESGVLSLDFMIETSAATLNAIH